MSDLFSISGSIGRGRYAMAVFLKILPLALTANAVAMWYYMNSHADVMAAIQAQDRAALGDFANYFAKVWTAIFVAVTVLWLNVAVKRLRNIWASGWWSILLLVPFVQLFVFAYLLLVKWEDLDDYSYDDDAMPLGFKVIFWLSLLSVGSVAFMLWLWYVKGTIWAQFGPNTLIGNSAALAYVAIWILNGSVAYGVYKRKEWAYFAVMGVSLFELVLSSANYFFVSKNPAIMTEYYRIMNIADIPTHEAIMTSMAYSTGFSIIAGIAFIFYVNKNLNYFTE